MDNEKLYEELMEVKAVNSSNSQELKSHNERLIKVEDEVKVINKMATNIEIIATEFKYMRDDVTDVKDGQKDMRQEIEEIKNTPDKEKASLFKRYRDDILWIVIGGIILYLLSQILPNIF